MKHISIYKFVKFFELCNKIRQNPLQNDAKFGS